MVQEEAGQAFTEKEHSAEKIKEKRKPVKKKKQEPQALDTSALLKKKDQRNQ